MDLGNDGRAFFVRVSEFQSTVRLLTADVVKFSFPLFLPVGRMQNCPHFPGIINTAMYKSDMPGRYPLNANTSLTVNVVG